MNRFGTSALLLLLSLGCEQFDPPPRVRLVGNDNGVMVTSPEAPLELEFTEPYVAESLGLKVVRAQTDAEGNLLDEQSPPQVEEFRANTRLGYDGRVPEEAFGAVFEPSGLRFVMRPDVAFPWSVPFLLLVEPGLEDLDGNKTRPRKRIPFIYQLPEGGRNSLPNGYFYFLMDIEFLATQIQVYAFFEVDNVGGDWRAIFTNGNRRPALNARPGCPSCDQSDPICALHPAPQCVKPSVKQTDVRHFRDFLPEPERPDGYTFIADGFARDEPDGSIAIGTKPFLIDITVGSGDVHIEAEQSLVTGSFRRSATDPDRWIAEGSVRVDVVKLNGNGSTGTKGKFSAMNLTAEEVAEIEAFGYPVPTNLR
jgi:hypothetical protein